MMRSNKRKVPLLATNNNAVAEHGSFKPKLRRLVFQLPLPVRPSVVGRALVCGQGDLGQLGLGADDSKWECKRPALIDSLKNVVDVCAGGMHNLILTNEGVIYSFGCNDEGALGRDSSEEGSEFEPRKIDLPGKVVKISAGDSHSACLLEDGRVFAWGSFRNSHGNMGLTMEGNKRSPVQILPDFKCTDIASGEDHLVILTSSGKVYTVGSAEQGQLGRVSLRSASGEGRQGMTKLLRPGQVQMRRAKPIEAIWATNYGTFLRESQTGYIWAFGLNNYNQLGVSQDSQVIIIPMNTNITDVKQIAGGMHHTMILKNDGSVMVIGRKDYGRLGLGPDCTDLKEFKPIPTLAGKKFASITCGGAQSFAITQDGQLYAWGMGSNFQLGTGTEDDSVEPTLIVSKQTQGKRIVRASSGGQHSIFLVEDDVQPDSTVNEEEIALANKEQDKLDTIDNKEQESENTNGDADSVKSDISSQKSNNDKKNTNRKDENDSYDDNDGKETNEAKSDSSMHDI